MHAVAANMQRLLGAACANLTSTRVVLVPGCLAVQAGSLRHALAAALHFAPLQLGCKFYPLPPLLCCHMVPLQAGPPQRG